VSSAALCSGVCMFFLQSVRPRFSLIKNTDEFTASCLFQSFTLYPSSISVTQNVNHKIAKWWVNNVVERIPKEAVVIHNLRYYPGICLRQANRSLGRDSNPGPIEHEAGILPTLPPPSVSKLQTNYFRLNW
jgi:hypothetical protein